MGPQLIGVIMRYRLGSEGRKLKMSSVTTPPEKSHSVRKACYRASIVYISIN